VRFVLANRLLDRAGGTEVHLLTLAEQLQRLGHEVCLYSPELGPFTDHVRRRGVDVAAELRDLPGACDVVLSQDALVVYDLAERYPSAFHAFRVCGDVFDFQFPPQLDGIVDLIVVLSDRYERLARACTVAPIRPRPRRAVLLGNYLERDELISEAWGRHGVEVSRVGGNSQRYDLSTALADADIVVAKGRAALDAMACGRAVYVFDVLGGDGWVTTASYAALDADNFAGGATPRVIGAAELERDLADYDPRMGIANRDLIAQHHDARDHAIEFLKAIDVREPIERPAAPLQELARLTSLQWSWERLAHGLQGERAEWVERIHHAEQRAADADAVAAAQVERVQHLERIAAEADAAAEGERAVLVERVRSLEQRVAEADAAGMRHNAESESRGAQLDAMRATRAWRLASGYWRIRKRLVAWRGRTTRGQ
jgi:hypothetical protein